MTTNPGGVVDPQDLVGRDAELFRLARSIDTGGAKLLGDRRMGKTSLLRKLEVQLRGVGHTVIRVSAETNDPDTFGRNLLNAMRSERALQRQWPQWEKELGGELRVDVGVFGIKLTGRLSGGGKPVEADLFKRCADATRDAGPYKLIFILDEITVLARALGEQGPGATEEFLRTLRVPRQEIDQVAMILAGSIGLHHVVQDLSVVNDLDSVVVGPLTNTEAIYLARCLLRGEQISTSNEVAIATVIGDQACSIPFYIHKLVQELAERGIEEPLESDVVGLVDDAVRSNRWETRHYSTRIPALYGGDTDLVMAMLDAYASRVDSLGIEELYAQLDAIEFDKRPSRNVMLGLVDRLEADHYLVRTGASDRFATSLLRRAWREMRRLA